MFCIKCGEENPAAAQYCHSCGSAISDISNMPEQYAGFWQRFAAVFIDGLILYFISIPIVIVVALMGSSSQTETAAAALLYLVVFAISAVYFAVMESGERGATFGKRLVGIKVADSNGNRISFGRALGRWFSHVFSYLTLYIGFLIQPFTKHKQALHDMVSGTYVMATRGKTSSAAVVVIVCLFITIALVGILAAIAIPAYQDYTVRAKVAGGYAAATEAGRLVENYYLNQGAIPGTLEEAGYAPQAIPHVSELKINPQNAEIVVVYKALSTVSPEPKHLVFTPYETDSGLGWKCWSPDLEPKMLPQACRQG